MCIFSPLVHSVRFYRIDKTSGVAKVIREENHISASPNPVSVGTPVRITVPEGKSPRTLTITTLNGTPVFSKQISPSATNFSIPTHSLTPGIYLFTLTSATQTLSTRKIIVR